MTKGLVLISGVNGHIASGVAKAFLDAGYTVRGTVRSQTKGEQFVAAPAFKNSFASGQFTFVVVEDITSDGAFDEAVKGVVYFCHAASPIPGKTNGGNNEDNFLIPALRGTETALRSAAKEASVKKFILLASLAGSIDYANSSQAGKVYGDTTWNTVPYEYAKTADPFTAYAVSKTIAEKAAWDFVEKEKPAFKLVAIKPSYVYGESFAPIDPKAPFTGTNWFLASQFLDPKYDFAAAPGYPNFVDLRDVAAAHVLAVENDKANGRRFNITAPKVHPTEYPALIARGAPELASRLPNAPEGFVIPETYDIDATPSETVLGVKYHSVEETLGDTARWIFKVSDGLQAD